MVAVTAREQFLLELVNRARHDPLGEIARLNAQSEAMRLGLPVMTGLDDGLPPGTIAPTSKAPLAFVELLGHAAREHSLAMLALDFFDHVGRDGRRPHERIFDAGWRDDGRGWATGENIAWAGGSAPGYAERETTLLLHHFGLFQSPGHRVNLLSERFSEVGLGQALGAFTPSGGVTWGSTSVLTQKFADAGRVFLTGVALVDANANGFYDIGEGRGGITVTATRADGARFATATWEAGGYTLALPAGTYEITFSGGGILAPVVKSASITDRNVKLDLFLGARDAAGEVDGPQRIEGGPGLDVFELALSRDAARIERVDGAIVVSAEALTLTLVSIERIVFLDGTLALDVDGNAGAGARLYRAAFAREPDVEGVGFWVRALDAGKPLADAAAGFVASAEFRALYGESPTNAAFVEALYMNVLGRRPDVQGAAFWEGLLAQGTARAQVLVAFSESPENVALTAPALADGIFML